MSIIEKSDENIRGMVLEYLAEKKRQNPRYRVIDVGGGANPWCDKYVDAYVDMYPFKTDKQLFLGDINMQPVWEAIGREKFDFSICTHTLEDIWNPVYVIGKLVSLTGAGFISMPNKHSEMSCVESVYWIGYCHHRWVFSISENDVLRIFPKLPLTSYFSVAHRLAHFLGALDSGLISGLMRKIKRMPVASGIKWVKKEKTIPGKELGFIWEGGFKYEFANGGSIGRNVFEAARLYTDELENGI